MQKLIIKSQFMGVKPCEIELRKFLLLIGEQASGKSTIAKLIYFFQTLPDAVYENAVLVYSKGLAQFDFVEDITKVARYKFLETFGPTTRAENFEILFYYTKADFVKIYQGRRDRLTYAVFETQFGRAIGRQVMDFYYAPRSSEAQKVDEIFLRQTLKQQLNRLFQRENSDYTFLIAGRNTSVAFPESFEKVALLEKAKIEEDEVKETDFESRQRRGNERLLYKFVDWSGGVKRYFLNNGQSFRVAARYLENRDKLNLINEIAERILKAKYRSEDSGESLEVAKTNMRVQLKDASSGQQEVLRIIQAIFLAIGLKNRKEFLIIEEPEAHLFPLAQRELINAFALFLNTIPEGRLIITTHSPYILACVNILLMANYTANQNGEVLRKKVGESVEQDFWIKSEDFNAYALGGEEYRVDIKDPVTGLISQNYLDAISEHLGIQFHQLYDLLTQSA